MPRVTFHTLGCKLNLAETSSLRRGFEERAFTVAPAGEPADVAVINTCSVTAEADRKCRQFIRRTLRANPETCVVVTGCYAQLQPKLVAAIPGVDVVLGSHEKARLFDIVTTFEKRPKTQISVSCVGDLTSFDPALLSDDRTRAFLKVQDGCDYSCSFCTIPLARGKSRSADPEQLLGQARDLASRGVKEIVLTGVNIGLYGQGTHDAAGSERLLQLLHRLEGVAGIERYRMSSIEPNLLTDEMIDFVAASPTFVPHFHIPLQSGDDAVLGAMRRRYRRARYCDRVARITRLMPEASVGVDVIVGFPAETAARFENTHQFLLDLPVSYLHVFTFSERPGTAAVRELNRQASSAVPSRERSQRNRALRDLSETKRVAFYRRHVGTVRPVLWERAHSGGMMLGFTDNYIKVARPVDPERIGTVEPVLLGAFAGRVVTADLF